MFMFVLCSVMFSFLYLLMFISFVPRHRIPVQFFVFVNFSNVYVCFLFRHVQFFAFANFSNFIQVLVMYLNLWVYLIVFVFIGCVLILWNFVLQFFVFFNFSNVLQVYLNVRPYLFVFVFVVEVLLIFFVFVGYKRISFHWQFSAGIS